jgi:hypothetical protein
MSSIVDLLHERTGDTWATRVSSYRTRRLEPEMVRQAFLAASLRASAARCPRRMVRIVAMPSPVCAAGLVVLVAMATILAPALHRLRHEFHWEAGE